MKLYHAPGRAELIFLLQPPHCGLRGKQRAQRAIGFCRVRPRQAAGPIVAALWRDMNDSDLRLPPATSEGCQHDRRQNENEGTARSGNHKSVPELNRVHPKMFQPQLYGSNEPVRFGTSRKHQEQSDEMISVFALARRQYRDEAIMPAGAVLQRD
ncbi:hypothetical protein L6R21_22955 [bacterium]|nr:hypothetical protein [bacterium]